MNDMCVHSKLIADLIPCSGGQKKLFIDLTISLRFLFIFNICWLHCQLIMSQPEGFNMGSNKTNFGYHFAILHRLIIAMSKKQIMDLGIQPSQIPFLTELLHYDKPVTQDALSAILVIDKGATARVLNKLEQDGFVRRMVNPKDRREKLVTATGKAKAIKKELYSIIRANIEKITQGFSNEEINQIIKTMDRMITNALAQYNK